VVGGRSPSSLFLRPNEGLERVRWCPRNIIMIWLVGPGHVVPVRPVPVPMWHLFGSLWSAVGGGEMGRFLRGHHVRGLLVALNIPTSDTSVCMYYVV
jgi:hypothetical protein